MFSPFECSNVFPRKVPGDLSPGISGHLGAGEWHMERAVVPLGDRSHPSQRQGQLRGTGENMSGAMTAMVPSGAAESSQPGPVLGQDLAPPLMGTDIFKDNGFDRAPAPEQQLMVANILPRA